MDSKEECGLQKSVQHIEDINRTIDLKYVSPRVRQRLTPHHGYWEKTKDVLMEAVRRSLREESQVNSIYPFWIRLICTVQIYSREGGHVGEKTYAPRVDKRLIMRVSDLYYYLQNSIQLIANHVPQESLQITYRVILTENLCPPNAIVLKHQRENHY